jgi:hypothetical protein
VCAILLVPARNVVAIPPYLVYLLFMVLGHFFAAHGVSIGKPGGGPSPLYLPAGTLRLLIVLMLAGGVGWKYYSDPASLQAQFEATVDGLKDQPFLPALLLGAFFLGVVVRAVVGRESPPVVLQDIEAWTSLLSLVGLGVAAIIHLIIQPSLEEANPLPGVEAVLASVIAFYFGERS